MTVVGREKMVVFDDMELERKVTVYEKSPWKRAETYGEWQTRSGDIFIPKIATDEPLRLECAHFLRLVDGDGDREQGRARRRTGRARARDADELARWPLRSTRPPSSTRARCSATACACSRTPSSASSRRSSPRSTAKREPLPPTVIGDGTVVSTGAIVFAGLDDRRARDRRRPVVHPRARDRSATTCVVGRGSLIENDTTIGARTQIQAGAYITAYSTLEEDVFIAPCVVTTNDNFMGRTEKRHDADARPDDPARRPRRRRRDPLPRRRDRRGGVRRRGRRRDEGRPAAQDRRRQPGARRCATCPPTSCCAERAAARATACTTTGSRGVDDELRLEVVHAADPRARRRAAPACPRGRPGDTARRVDVEPVDALRAGRQSASRRRGRAPRGVRRAKSRCPFFSATR